MDGEKVFHAGTRLEGDQVVTAGGRVLCATALGATVTEAQQRAYALAGRIQWRDVFYRKDIAYGPLPGNRPDPTRPARSPTGLFPVWGCAPPRRDYNPPAKHGTF